MLPPYRKFQSAIIKFQDKNYFFIDISFSSYRFWLFFGLFLGLLFAFIFFILLPDYFSLRYYSTKFHIGTLQILSLISYILALVFFFLFRYLVFSRKKIPLFENYNKPHFLLKIGSIKSIYWNKNLIKFVFLFPVMWRRVMLWSLILGEYKKMPKIENGCVGEKLTLSKRFVFIEFVIRLIMFLSAMFIFVTYKNWIMFYVKVLPINFFVVGFFIVFLWVLYVFAPLLFKNIEIFSFKQQ